MWLSHNLSVISYQSNMYFHLTLIIIHVTLLINKSLDKITPCCKRYKKCPFFVIPTYSLLIGLWIGVYWRVVASIARDIITVLFQKCCNLLSWDMAFFTKEILERNSLVWTRNNQNGHISLNVFLMNIPGQNFGSRHGIQ